MSSTLPVPVPVGSRVLVRQHKKEVTKSGLILASEMDDALKLPKGDVIAVGAGAEASMARGAASRPR